MKITETHYIKGKKKYHRVTSLCNVLHDPCYENLCRAKGFHAVDQIYEKAASRGKSIHAAMRIIAEGKFSGFIEDVYKKQENIFPDIQAGREWLEDYIKNKKIAFIEKTFFSDKLEFAGTPDLVITQNDKTAILIDYKTGAKIAPTARLQTAAYAHLIKENTGLKITKRIIIHLRNGKYKIIPLESDLNVDFYLFSYIITINNQLNII